MKLKKVELCNSEIKLSISQQEPSAASHPAPDKPERKISKGRLKERLSYNVGLQESPIYCMGLHKKHFWSFDRILPSNFQSFHESPDWQKKYLSLVLVLQAFTGP